MTYKKPIKFFGCTTLMDENVSAEDADNKREGSYAIEVFEAHKTLKLYGADAETGELNKETLVPFHAIKSAHYGTMTEDTEKADPYCK